MVFDARVQVLADDVQQDPASVPSCICSKKILVPKSVSRKSVTFVWTAGTNYNQKNGNSAAGYSFKGADPSAAVLSTIQATGDVSYQELRNRHIEDHDALFGTFQLELPDTRESAETPTAQLVAEYTVDEGNPFLESLLFDYGRYLFIASSRAGSMPPNLAGMWTESLAPAWSADYHLDINLQMYVTQPPVVCHQSILFFCCTMARFHEHACSLTQYLLGTTGIRKPPAWAASRSRYGTSLSILGYRAALKQRSFYMMLRVLSFSPTQTLLASQGRRLSHRNTLSSHH